MLTGTLPLSRFAWPVFLHGASGTHRFSHRTTSHRSSPHKPSSLIGVRASRIQSQAKRLTPTDRDIGKLVTVKGYDCLAVLQFIGAHKEKGHLRCGVELDQPIGNNDGTVNGHEVNSAANHACMVADVPRRQLSVCCLFVACLRALRTRPAPPMAHHPTRAHSPTDSLHSLCGSVLSSSQYFSCEKGFGVLCAVKKVTMYHDELTAPKLRGGGEASA